jgi:CubicO group peptidase (beta-lactamase class C family)
MVVIRNMSAAIFRSIFVTSLVSATACSWFDTGGDETDGTIDTSHHEDNTDSSMDTNDSDGSDEDTGFVNDAGDVYPGDEWPSGDPAAHGFDADKLEEAAAIADDEDSHCLMVVHQGNVIGQWYFDDWDVTSQQNVFSITKSFASIALGIASDMGYLDVTDPASLYISEWQNTDSEDVTIAQLLSQTSGRYWELINDYLGLGGAEDMTAFAVDLNQEVTPGTEWEYNNAGVQTLERVMTEATGKALDEFASLHLLSKLGMSSTFARDGAENTVAYSDLSASCADLARFGYLLLKNGRWGNEQIISKDYLDAALHPSSELNTAYGYLFWLNRDGHWVEPSTADDVKIEGDGKMYPSLPENMVWAEGLQDQLTVVFPDDDLIVTRIGGTGDAVSAFTSGNLGDNAFVEDLLSTILAAKN